MQGRDNIGGYRSIEKNGNELRTCSARFEAFKQLLFQTDYRELPKPMLLAAFNH